MISIWDGDVQVKVGGGAMKKRWSKAQLIVLGRARTQEGVLGLCKVGGEMGPPDLVGNHHQCSSSQTGGEHCQDHTNS
jgi:hypothetical protein